MAGKVITCNTAKELTDQLEMAKESKKLVVVDFTATWCGPCRMMAPVFAQISEALPHVVFLMVDIDQLRSVMYEWVVKAVPTFVLIKEGKTVERVVGVWEKDELEGVITLHANAPANAPAVAFASA